MTREELINNGFIQDPSDESTFTKYFNSRIFIEFDNDPDENIEVDSYFVSMDLNNPDYRYIGCSEMDIYEADEPDYITEAFERCEVSMVTWNSLGNFENGDKPRLN